MMLLTVFPRLAGGMLPARLPGGAASGLAYIGEADGEHIFAQGGGIEKRVRDPRRCALVQVTWQGNSAGGVSSVQYCAGLEASAGISVRHELQGRNFILEVRDAGNPDQTARTVYSLNSATYAMGDN